MVVIGMVTVNRLSEAKDKEGNPYKNFSIDGFDMIPSNGLDLPKEGLTVKAHVSTHYRKGARPLHFLKAWESV